MLHNELLIKNLKGKNHRNKQFDRAIFAEDPAEQGVQQTPMFNTL